MRMKILGSVLPGLLILSLSGTSQAGPVLKVGSVSAKAGETVNIPISLDPGAATITSVQFDLTLPPGLSTGTVTADPALGGAGKTVSAMLRGNQWRFIIFGVNQTALGKNNLLTAQLAIAPGTVPGALRLPVTNVVFADAKGAAIPPGKSPPGKVAVMRP